MIKEELYIIVDGVREQLDIPSPSGITLNYVSNLFNDLSKINASYTYTFKLPRTANNVRVLEIVDDVRADGKFTRIKNDAEYVYDGVSLFSNANMYISGVEKESISAVMTWNVNKGLQELEKHDMSLQELGNHLPEGEYDYVGDEISDYEKDKVVTVAGWDSDRPTFAERNTYVPTSPSFISLHNAGLFPYYYRQAPAGRYPVEINTVDFRQFVPSHTLCVLNGHLNPEIPPIRTTDEVDYNRTPDAGYYDGEGNVAFTTYAFPTPIIPVPYIVSIISKIYGINFDFDSSKYNSLCLPLVMNKVSDALARLNYARVVVIPDQDTRMRPFSNRQGFVNMRVDTINNYPNINPLGEFVTTTEHSMFDGGLVFQSYYFDSVKRIGRVNKAMEAKFMVFGNLTIDVESPAQSHNIPMFYSDGEPRLTILAQSYKYTDDDFYEIGTLHARSISYYTENGVDYTRLSFNYDPSDGWDIFMTEPICFASIAFNLRYGKDDSFSYYKIKEGYGALYMSVLPTNYVYGCQVNLFKNLPDISCMDFIKSICYALGGYPYQDADGKIKLQEYSNLVTCITTGDVNDWSAKITKTLGENSEDLNFDANNVTGLTLAKNNYFLMRNDKVDEFGKEEINNKMEDAYEHGYECMEIDSDLLDETQTLFTYPFYGGFLWEKGCYGRRKFYAQTNLFDPSISPDTPKANDMWYIANEDDDTALNTSWYLKISTRDAKPILGVVTAISVPEAVFSQWQTVNNNDIDPDTGLGQVTSQGIEISYTGNYTDYLSMRPWNCATDMPKVNGHDLLQELFGNPCLVKEDMNLNVADLASLDMEKPVYLEKYNSYFAIKKIEVSSSDGISKVELIRIPTEILEPAPPTPEVIVEPPTVEPTEPEPSDEPEPSASD